MSNTNPAVEEAFDHPERSRKPAEPTNVDKAFDSGSSAGGHDPLKNTNPAVEEAFDKPDKSRKEKDDRSYVDKAFDTGSKKPDQGGQKTHVDEAFDTESKSLKDRMDPRK